MSEKAKKKKKDAWFLLGILVCIGLMAFAAWQIHERTKEFTDSDRANSDLQSLIINHDPQPNTFDASESELSPGMVYEGVPISEMDQTEAQTDREPAESQTDAGRTGPLPVQMNQMELGLIDRVNLDQLMREYPAAVGWIYQPNTVIDYPVMRGEDNNYYLKRLYNGSVNGLGSIFMDYRNAADFSDSNTILYGHHMRSGKMFASISGYKKQEYYDEHPVMYLFTKDGIFRVELVAGYVVSGKSNNIPFNYEEEGSFEAFRDSVYEKSTFDSGIEMDQDDYLLILATCSYEFTNARYLVLGRMRELVEPMSVKDLERSEKYE